jgi:hypothetical protein
MVDFEQITNKLVTMLEKEYSSIISVYSDKGEYSITSSHDKKDEIVSNNSHIVTYNNYDAIIYFMWVFGKGKPRLSIGSNKGFNQNIALKSDPSYSTPIYHFDSLDWYEDYIVTVGLYKFWISTRLY